MAKWNFCPLCAGALEDRLLDDSTKRACSKCSFVHWDSPVPVVAVLVPMDGGVVLVQRKVAPFVGRWCLPRGFMKSAEIPKRAAVRETLEETGLKVRLLRMLNACNPSPPGFQLNQVTMFYLGLVREGTLNAGDDALSVGVFKPDALPDICFPSDVKLIVDWFDGKHGGLESPVNYPQPGETACTTA